MNYWVGYLLLLLLGGSGLLALLIYLYWAKKKSGLLINVVLILLSLFVTFMALEFYFKVFFYESDSLGTLALRNWRDRYYTGGFNSNRYRDVEWTDEMVAGKTKVMVVGDSFVEGVGIKYTQDRFSNQLAQNLGDNYVVFNLGKSGTDTKDHIRFIVEYPYSPDILILSYYINDVKGAVSPKNWIRQPRFPEIPTILSPLVNNSYAFNFFYWRIVRVVYAEQLAAEWPWLLSVYNDPVDWWTHEQQLLQIYEGVSSEDIPLIVVVFPSLTDIESTKVITDRIINWFEEREIPVIDVADLVKGMPTKQLVVNSVDAHANEKVNKMIAEELYRTLVEQGSVTEQR